MPSAGTVSALADIRRDPSCRLLREWMDQSSAEAPPPTVPFAVDFAASPFDLGTGLWDDPTGFEPLPLYVTPRSMRLADDMQVVRVAGQMFGVAVVVSGEPAFAERFEALRARLRLPVHKYAVLLGTTRRTLYHWLETGRPQQAAIDRLNQIAEWVSILERSRSPSELLGLLDPDATGSIGEVLVQSGEEAAANSVAILATPAQPLVSRRLDRLANDDIAEPPFVMTANDVRTALTRFATPRARADAPPVLWTPPELTDADADDST
jgi:hypothetical protein